MTEQALTPAPPAPPVPASAPATEPVPTTEPVPATGPAPATEPVPTTEPAPGPAPEAGTAPAPKKSRRPLLWGVARWTAAVLVCGGVGAGTALGITALERTDVPGLATASDGRWDYPELTLPALPEDAPRPWTEGNDGEIHHADLRKLLLPAPAGATVDPKSNGGWTGLDSYLALLPEKDRAGVGAYVADSALRHVTARGWTTPDGTTTRVHLLRFASVAFAEDFKDETMEGVSKSTRMPLGVEAAEIDASVQKVEVPHLSLYSYAETEPYGPEQTRWAYIQAGDTVGVVTQTRKGGVPTVPFQQTVALQAQLLG
ncbi:hypothetical protein ACFUJ0_23115 [Streptomyces sp. NPDC057242]|uniref:hypothetical protein n=1 Tax=unclassified Streptomyces TaxID=2593676 RepID=UPI0036382131